MCGIFGYIPKNDRAILATKTIVDRLFLLSQSRGKDASGIAVVFNDSIKVLKRPISAAKLIKSTEYRQLVSASEYLGLIGHARMETNGSFGQSYNNQPVVKNDYITIHNGIIVNDEALFKKYDLRRDFEVDTEIINALVGKYVLEGSQLDCAIKETLKQCEGSYSIALIAASSNNLFLSTNTGSLYIADTSDYFIFASENYFVEQILGNDENYEIHHITPGSLLTFDLSAKTYVLSDIESREVYIDSTCPSRSIDIIGDVPDIPKGPQIVTCDIIKLSQVISKAYEETKEKVSKLRRCTKCLLPETMPFISFDANGVCNYCSSYKPQELLGTEELLKVIERYKSTDGSPDCIVPFSGGRDSSYGLHYIKNILKLNPITFTYDWGMVTDLARRNIARMCGKLGVENILVSADIQLKRENIRKNIGSWLKNPTLGTIPLFMAGDKQFFYYTNKLKLETRVAMNIWMGNKLENTFFKVGFCGISPDFDKKRIDHLNLKHKVDLALYYLFQYVKNPSYINSSLIDTIGAYSSYYLEKRTDYFLLYDYIKWDEKLIEDTLIYQYNWETSPDTASTWRIGDGTAAFYNYIYYMIAGFSEIDTFRSNQVREGTISREKALYLIEKENTPRVESIKWYCDTINIDAVKAISVINSSRKLY